MKRSTRKMPATLVQVEAREGADLQILSRIGDSPLLVPCGPIGRIIAEDVLKGGGHAVMPLCDILPAIDTTDGVNALLDNFDLIDPDTQSPLLTLLIRKVCGGNT